MTDPLPSVYAAHLLFLSLPYRFHTSLAIIPIFVPYLAALTTVSSDLI